MKRYCSYPNCTSSTNKNLSDFHEINWEALSYNYQKAVSLCPNHNLSNDEKTEFLIKKSRGLI